MESSLLRDFKNLLISTVDDSNIIEGKDDNSNNIDKIRLGSSYFEPEMNLVNIRTKSSTSRSETHGNTFFSSASASIHVMKRTNY